MAKRLLRKKCSRCKTNQVYSITCPSHTQNIKFETLCIFRSKEKLVMNIKLYTTVIKGKHKALRDYE